MSPTGRSPGRGAHLHPTSTCLTLAVRRRALPRALRVEGPLSTARLEDYVRERTQQHGRTGKERERSS